MAKGEFKKQLRQITEEREKGLKETKPNVNQELRSVDLYKKDIIRGDVFFFDKGYTLGVEQKGGRPGIIVSNDKCNNSSDFVLVVYLTTEPKTSLPTHIDISGLDKPSLALCEQIHTLSKHKMQSYKGHVSDEELLAIDIAMIETLGIDLREISPDYYYDLLKEIKDNKNLREDNDKLNTEIKTLEIRIENLLKTKEKLEQQSVPVSEDSELIKIKAERDMYERLYDKLLKNIIKEV